MEVFHIVKRVNCKTFFTFSFSPFTKKTQHSNMSMEVYEINPSVHKDRMCFQGWGFNNHTKHKDKGPWQSRWLL